MKTMKYLVDVSWLVDNINRDDVVVLCASMGNPAKSLASGIPGAVLADLEGQFSEADAKLPHTVPAQLQEIFEQAGISSDTTVVVYDRFGVVCSPRVWWLARAAGLENVFVLDGGLPAWLHAQHDVEPIEQLEKDRTRGRIEAQARPELFTDIRGVQHALARSNRAVVDARSAGRFAGVEPEPRQGLRGGHIPGSVNVPYTTLFDEHGLLLPVSDLRRKFREQVDDAAQLTFTCGSGVTACVLALAAAEAGYEDLVVYDGSWSEWGLPESEQPVDSVR